MSGSPMSPISVADSERAYATLTASLADNPFDRWLFPDDDVYERVLPLFVASVAGVAFANHTAWQLEDFSAVVLLRAPGVEPNPEDIGETLRSAIDPSKHADLFDSLEQMEHGHPRGAHWYLPCIGVDPARRGTGLGGRLLTECLAYVDVTGLPVFLQSYSARTVPFFERHGFVVTGHVDAGSAPQLTMMLRPGRGD